jgi:putative hydrolase of the HAD superfamily
MSENAPIKGIIFDMDDTLIDWSNVQDGWHDIERAHLQRVLDHARTASTPLDTTLETFVDAFRENMMQAWSVGRETLRAPHTGKVLIETMQTFGFRESETCNQATCLQSYGWRGVDGVVAFPDVGPALAKMYAQGYKIGLMTNASQPMAMRLPELEAKGLARYFPDESMLFSAADIGYLKPHPRAFLTVVDAIGTRPEETIYVGDNPVADIAGAQGAGLRGVLRVNQGVPAMISGVIVPDAAINDFDDLLRLLADWDAYTHDALASDS